MGTEHQTQPESARVAGHRRSRSILLLVLALILAPVLACAGVPAAAQGGIVSLPTGLYTLGPLSLSAVTFARRDFPSDRSRIIFSTQPQVIGVAWVIDLPKEQRFWSMVLALVNE
jgi:nitrate reductase NapE component